MRGYSRYKIFQKGYNLNFLPTRILNLKRPKWDLLKLKTKRLKFLKNSQITTSNFFKSFNTKNFLVGLVQSNINTLYPKAKASPYPHFKKVVTFKKR